MLKDKTKLKEPLPKMLGFRPHWRGFGWRVKAAEAPQAEAEETAHQGATPVSRVHLLCKVEVTTVPTVLL